MINFGSILKPACACASVRWMKLPTPLRRSSVQGWVIFETLELKPALACFHCFVQSADQTLIPEPAVKTRSNPKIIINCHVFEHHPLTFPQASVYIFGVCQSIFIEN